MFPFQYTLSCNCRNQHYAITPHISFKFIKHSHTHTKPNQTKKKQNKTTKTKPSVKEDIDLFDI